MARDGGEAGLGAGGAPYLEPYRQVLARTGPTFEALLWRSPASQEARFAALAASVDFRGRALADLGCGRGDLAAWLRERGIEHGRYVGVEALGPMLECARRRAAERGLARTEFVLADFARDEGLFTRLVADGVDTLVFSGSLNTFDEGAAVEVLRRAWRAVRGVRGGVLAFNFLSDGARPRWRRGGGPGAARGPLAGALAARSFDTRRMLGFALRRTRLVLFRQDYLGPRDATIVMRARG